MVTKTINPPCLTAAVAAVKISGQEIYHNKILLSNVQNVALPFSSMNTGEWVKLLVRMQINCK